MGEIEIEKEDFDLAQREARYTVLSEKYEELDNLKETMNPHERLYQIYDMIQQDLLLEMENEKE